MGRHQSHQRRALRPVVALLVGALVLFGVGTVVGLRVVGEREDSSPRAAAATARCDALLNIVTARSFEPVLRKLAPSLESGEDCVRLNVEVADGRAAAARVAELGADVWIPDDTAWASQAGETKLAPSTTVVATSPIYMVTDRATGDRVTQAGGGWLALANLVANSDSGVRLVARDPGGSGDGMLGIGAVGEAVWVAESMDASSEALADALPSTRTVSGQALPETPGEVGLVAEYALVSLLRDDDDQAKVDRATLLPGSDHSAVLRYTWLPTADAEADPELKAPMERVLAALTGPEAADALAEANLRRADVAPLPNVPDQLPALAAAPFDVLGEHHVEHVFATWYADERRSNMLVVVDVSGSMRAPAPESNRPLVDLVRDGVTTLGELLPDESELSLWEFGSAIDPATQSDYRTVLPRAPLSAKQRQDFTAATAGLTWRDTGTGLYDTVLAAYTSARDNYQEGVANHVVLFTDGRNQDDANSISAEQLTQEITKVMDDTRPVSFTAIVFGSEEVASVLEKALEPIDAYVESASTAGAVRASFIHAAAGGGGH